MQERPRRGMRHIPVAHPIPIQAVSGYWMTEMGGMHPYLVGTPRLDGKFNERQSPLPRKNGPMRDCRLAVAIYHRHTFCIKRLAPYKRFERALFRLRNTMKHGQIGLLYISVVLKLTSQREIRLLVAGKNHNPACIAIQTMNKPGTFNTADTCDIRKLLQKDVAESSVGIPRSSMHYDSGRLIDNDYVIIRINDFYGYATFRFYLLFR